MCAKGKAWERLTGAEVVALAAVSSVRCPSRGPHCLHTAAIVAHSAEHSKVLFPSLWTRQRHVDKNLPTWYKR